MLGVCTISGVFSKGYRAARASKRVAIWLAQHLPAPASTLFVDWQARRIQNPIEKLRYLRIQARRPGKALKTATGSRIAVAVVICALGPVQIASDATIRARLEPAVPIDWKAVPSVWLVESSREQETYSNGLRIENRWAVTNRPRSYVA